MNESLRRILAKSEVSGDLSSNFDLDPISVDLDSNLVDLIDTVSVFEYAEIGSSFALVEIASVVEHEPRFVSKTIDTVKRTVFITRYTSLLKSLENPARAFDLGFTSVCGFIIRSFECSL